MAGMAALRVGAGLSTVARPKSVLPTVAGFHPELMTEPLEETEAGSISLRALETDDRPTSGRQDGAGNRSRHFAKSGDCRIRAQRCEESKTPIVLDADGLNAFEGHAAELNGKDRTLVITPHPGEMARLIGSTPARYREIASTSREVLPESMN